MPRQIIDIESSRPAYVRRTIVRWVVLIVLLVIAAFVVLELLKSQHSVAAGVTQVPGKLAHRVNLGPIPQIRRGHAA
ncbi:MAG TPA: hypothetical protein VGN11_12500 [Candidatus Baltobacteraceae bacterium]|jgi:hypothetical protein|nr:hypothetical protein [Candidatus Baltobacteraceae bacterium]